MVEYQIINCRIAVPYDDFILQPEFHLVTSSDQPFEENITHISDSIPDIYSIYRGMNSTLRVFSNGKVPIVAELTFNCLYRKVFDDADGQLKSSTLLNTAAFDDSSIQILTAITGGHAYETIRKMEESSHLVHKMILAAERDNVFPQDVSYRDPYQADRFLFSHQETLGDRTLQIELAIDVFSRVFSIYIRGQAPNNQAAALIKANEMNNKYIHHTFYLDDHYAYMRATYLSNNDAEEVISAIAESINICFHEYAEYNERLGI